MTELIERKLLRRSKLAWMAFQWILTIVALFIIVMKLTSYTLTVIFVWFITVTGIRLIVYKIHLKLKQL